MKKEKILLIDADSLLYYEMNSESLDEAIAGIDDRINAMLTAAKTNTYTGFLTLSKCFRYDIDNSHVYDSTPYKHNRKGGPKPIIFYALKEYLQQDPHKFIGLKGLEADDAVGIYAQQAKDSGYKPIICSPDKDVLQQIPGNHYNYQKAKFVKTSKADAEKFLWKQTLMGDSTDGIPGIHGLGSKTADKLLEICGAFGEPDAPQIAIMEYIKKYGTREGVIRFAETFNLVYILRTEDEGTRITALPHISTLLTTLNPTSNAPATNDLFSSEWT
jgi:hypothetical protein